MKKEAHLTRWLAALVVLGATACSDNLTTRTDMVFDNQPPSGDDATFAFVQENVLDLHCAVSGCHAGSAFPNLSAGQAYANLVDAPSSQRLKMVEPGYPDSSYFYLKVTDGPGMQGSTMPRGSGLLPQATLDAIREWIELGAEQD